MNAFKDDDDDDDRYYDNLDTIMIIIDKYHDWLVTGKFFFTLFRASRAIVFWW